MKHVKLAVALASALVFIAGCAEMPTGGGDARIPERAPSFDGGLVFGSGNRMDSTQMTMSSSTSADSEKTRGGLVFGSGN